MATKQHTVPMYIICITVILTWLPRNHPPTCRCEGVLILQFPFYCSSSSFHSTVHPTVPILLFILQFPFYCSSSSSHSTIHPTVPILHCTVHLQFPFYCLSSSSHSTVHPSVPVLHSTVHPPVSILLFILQFPFYC